MVYLSHMNKKFRICLVAFLALGGCVGGDPSLDTDDGTSDPTATVEQEVGRESTYVNDYRIFGGNLFAEDFYYTIGDFCLPGFIRVERPGEPGTQWSSNVGGFCAFDHWLVPGNPHDCRAVIHAHTGGGWFGGDCLSSVKHERELPRQFDFTATNTSSATLNTIDRTFALTAGQRLTIGTCGVQDSSATGDTFLVLHSPARVPSFGISVATSDDACSGLASRIVYTATMSDSFVLSVGCYSNGTCGGTVAWTID